MTAETDNPTLKALQDQFASRVFGGLRLGCRCCHGRGVMAHH